LGCQRHDVSNDPSKSDNDASDCGECQRSDHLESSCNDFSALSGNVDTIGSSHYLLSGNSDRVLPSSDLFIVSSARSSGCAKSHPRRHHRLLAGDRLLVADGGPSSRNYGSASYCFLFGRLAANHGFTADDDGVRAGASSSDRLRLFRELTSSHSFPVRRGEFRGRPQLSFVGIVW
jgi:hypothetical protein